MLIILGFFWMFTVRGLIDGLRPSGTKLRSATGTMIFRQLFDRESCTFTYILGDEETKQAIIIDPVDTLVERDVEVLEKLGLDLKYAVNTHIQ